MTEESKVKPPFKITKDNEVISVTNSDTPETPFPEDMQTSDSKRFTEAEHFSFYASNPFSILVEKEPQTVVMRMSFPRLCTLASVYLEPMNEVGIYSSYNKWLPMPGSIYTYRDCDIKTLESIASPYGMTMHFTDSAEGITSVVLTCHGFYIAHSTSINKKALLHAGQLLALENLCSPHTGIATSMRLLMKWVILKIFKNYNYPLAEYFYKVQCFLVSDITFKLAKIIAALESYIGAKIDFYGRDGDYEIDHYWVDTEETLHLDDDWVGPIYILPEGSKYPVYLDQVYVMNDNSDEDDEVEVYDGTYPPPPVIFSKKKKKHPKMRKIKIKKSSS